MPDLSRLGLPGDDIVAGVRLVWARNDPAHVGDPLLDATERARCAAYHRAADGARHATGRVVVKREAGRLLGVAPDRVRVVVDPAPTAGRPRLQVDGRLVPLQVSLAHAGDVVLVALADGPCGVDVEQVEALRGLTASDLVFSPAERAALADLPDPGTGTERLDQAATWWTAKEAVLKATGRGLHLDPAAVDVIGAFVVSGGERWRWRPVAAPAGYRASLATPAVPAGSDP